jgi:hypothetical protein
MYTPGRLLQFFKCTTEKQKAYALNIINEKKELFITEVNISCPEDKRINLLTFIQV